MKRNYQRLKISALPSVPAKIFFACWMLFLATPSASFSQELVFKNPVLISGSAGQYNALRLFSNVSPTIDALLQVNGHLHYSVIIVKTDSAGKTNGLKNHVDIMFLTVKLTSFTAKGLDNDKVVLHWNTAREQNFSHFTVEKSLNGNEFSDAGIIFSMDDSDQARAYSFTDKLRAGETGIIYYRLKMVDVDGKTQLSPIKIVKLGEEKANSLTAIDSHRNELYRLI